MLVSRLRAPVLTSCLLVLCVAVRLWAQSRPASTVWWWSQADASITDAQIKLVNTATGVVSNTVSNSTGQYVFPFVLPGAYTLSVTHAGFKVWTKTFVAHANDRIAIECDPGGRRGERIG